MALKAKNPQRLRTVAESTRDYRHEPHFCSAFAAYSLMLQPNSCRENLLHNKPLHWQFQILSALYIAVEDFSRKLLPSKDGDHALWSPFFI